MGGGGGETVEGRWEGGNDGQMWERENYLYSICAISNLYKCFGSVWQLVRQTVVDWHYYNYYNLRSLKCL